MCGGARGPNRLPRLHVPEQSEFIYNGSLVATGPLSLSLSLSLSLYIYAFYFVFRISYLETSSLAAARSPSSSRLSLYKILFHFKAVLWSISSFYCYPPACNAYNIAILSHAHCTIHVPPPTLPLYAIHHTILMMAISCKGQLAAAGSFLVDVGIAEDLFPGGWDAGRKRLCTGSQG